MDCISRRGIIFVKSYVNLNTILRTWLFGMKKMSVSGYTTDDCDENFHLKTINFLSPWDEPVSPSDVLKASVK